jgi:hypothetical protein
MSPLRWDKVKFIKFFGRHFSNKGVVKVLGFGFLQAEKYNKHYSLFLLRLHHAFHPSLALGRSS